MVLLSLLLDTDLSNPGELDCPLVKLNGPGQSETVPDTPPLEARESDLLPRLETSIEVLEGPMEVSQSLLGFKLLAETARPR